MCKLLFSHHGNCFDKFALNVNRNLCNKFKTQHRMNEMNWQKIWEEKLKQKKKFQIKK